jgi:hypothetical protein
MVCDFSIGAEHLACLLYYTNSHLHYDRTCANPASQILATDNRYPRLSEQLPCLTSGNTTPHIVRHGLTKGMSANFQASINLQR